MGLQSKIRAYQAELLIAILFALLGGALQYREGREEVHELERAGPGEGEMEEELEVTIDTEKKAYHVILPERLLTVEEKKAYLKKAWKEVEEGFLEKGQELGHITERVHMQQQYADAMVTAEWKVELKNQEFDGTGTIDDLELPMGDQGEILEQLLTKEGATLEFTVRLICEDAMAEHTFLGRIYPKERKGMERLEYLLQQKIEESNKHTAYEKKMELPQEIENVQISWKKKAEHSGVKIWVLGLIMIVGLQARKRQQKKESEQKRKQKLELQYPEFVSQVALLLNAGMTMEMIFIRIGDNYKRTRERGKKEVYEELLVAVGQLKEGVAEGKVYEKFAERCGLPEYRRVCSYITQNLRKGSQALGSILDQEAKDAMQKRQSFAKKLGEEAETKMLLPMLCMLILVLVILIYPAIVVFQW